MRHIKHHGFTTTWIISKKSLTNSVLNNNGGSSISVSIIDCHIKVKVEGEGDDAEEQLSLSFSDRAFKSVFPSILVSENRYLEETLKIT